MNGSTSVLGFTIGPISGPFEVWSLCDKAQPNQAKLKMNGLSQAYGVTVLNTTVTQACTPGATADGTLVEEVDVSYLPSVCIGAPIPKNTNCASCPTYGVILTSCTGWTSVPDTIVSNGFSTPVTRFTSTGCGNSTSTVPQPTVSAL
jgi:hypothetical protein